jgi:hypothetical protein
MALRVDDLAYWVSPSFCKLDAATDLPTASSAYLAYRNNRPREAAAAFAAVARDATDPLARIDAWIAGARALKVLACDDGAMRSLDEALAVPGEAPPLVAARCRSRPQSRRRIALRRAAGCRRHRGRGAHHAGHRGNCQRRL